MNFRKFVIFIAFSSLCITSACQVGAQPTATPTQLPPPATPRPPTETPTPSATPQTAWHEDFQDTFALPWSWIDVNPAMWSLTGNPGYLRIYAAPYAGGGKNILVLMTPSGDFTAVTHLFFEPVKNFQFAGITLYIDETARVNFGRAFCGRETVCVGNGIYFDLIEGGALVEGSFATQVESTNETWLKLERIDANMTGSYSPDGVTWTVIGTHNLSPIFDSAQVGLFAFQDMDKSDDDIPADFDSFDLTLLP